MNHAAQLAIIKQLNRQESDGSAGNFKQMSIQESHSSVGPGHVTDHALITWLSYTDHVADHPLITWLSFTDHLTVHALIT